MKYDVLVLGSGPGGYVAAIRASQLGLKTAVIERESLGGICLNWGCIPTKALLKSAKVFEYLNHASDFGITVEGGKADFGAVIKRSRGVADGMSKGIQFLFKKNKIDAIMGNGILKKDKKIEVTAADGTKTTYEADHIIIATGARSKELPGIAIDKKNIIGYREAMSLPTMPESMVVIGAGAIGVEFAYFYHTMGTKVTVVEFMENGLVPREDAEISKELNKIYKKKGMTILGNTAVEKVDISGTKKKVTVKDRKTGESQVIECDVVLSATGVTPNLENIGLEEVGISIEKGFIKVDEFYNTSVKGYYAIGDVLPTQALAHLASAEGITCVEKIAGQHVQPIDYGNVPGCTYCSPEVASVGYTEVAAKEAGYELKIGKFPFAASGKAAAGGVKDGFVKLIFDAKYGELLGAHFIGDNVTEMIAEIVVPVNWRLQVTK